jgi:phosphatidylglycerophosphatase A
MRFFVLLVSSGLGTGYVPIAPGTAGSMLGALMAWGLWRITGFVGLGVAAVILIPASIWAASRAENYYGEHDSPHIVIDEVVGQLLSVLAVPCTGPNLLVAFGWFRLFDSVKPWPAGWIDRNVSGGLGVVLDDLAAGVYAAAATALMVYSGLVTRSIAWLSSFL